LRALREAVVEAPDRAFEYGDPRGHRSLRDELAAYLGRARGLSVTPENLIITSGYTQAVNLIAAVMPGRGLRRIAMEDPAVPEQREIVRRWGHEVVPIPVDDQGARVQALENCDANAVFLTPNRQHPLGMALSAQRRTWLLDWARGTGAFVIEDDYDGEFRYDGKPIGPLQGLDPQSVIYAGTASKTLAPALRLGWLAVPDRLMQALTDEKRLTDYGGPAVEQMALALLLRRGAYDRHIRKMRLAYRRRRDELVAAIRSVDPSAQITGTAAGLNLVLRLPDAELEARAIAAARARGVALGGLVQGHFFEAEGWPGLLIGYAAASAHDFPAALRALLVGLRDQTRVS
jgi:GntR family transcriptional regulator/MocR family aminotransferase